MDVEPIGAAVAQTADDNQFLTFTLGAAEYGLEILRVQEIKGLSMLTPIPNAPGWIKGVMNLRGTVVPVVDLRVKFGMPPTEDTKFKVVIVVTAGRRIFGLVVDAVSDVLNIPAGDVQPPPDLGSTDDISYLSGMWKSGEKFVLLLDIDRAIGGLGEAVH